MLEALPSRHNEPVEETEREIPDRKVLQKNLNEAIQGYVNGKAVEKRESRAAAALPGIRQNFPPAHGPGGNAIRHATKESFEQPTSKIRIFMFREADGSEKGLSKAGHAQISARLKLVHNPQIARGLHSGSAAAEETTRRAMRGRKSPSAGAPEHLIESAEPGHVRADERLSVEMKSSAGLQMAKAIKANNLLEWIVQESDVYVEDQRDKVGGSYIRMAANIARMIKTQYARADGWDLRARSNKLAKPEQENFWAASAGVTETFLAKVIEKTAGIAHRNAFVAVLGKNGFEPTEGYEVTVSNFKGKKVLNVRFNKTDKTGKTIFTFNQQISPELLDTIIADDTMMQKRIEQSGKAPVYNEAQILEKLEPKKKRTRRKTSGVLNQIEQGHTSD